MASRFVVCKDKEEAQRMADAGLLMCMFFDGWGPQGIAVELIMQQYGNSFWPPEDFAYLIEEDEDGSPTTEDDACD